MTPENPADAVREALDNLVQFLAREYGVTLEVHQRVAAVKNAMKQAEAQAEVNARDAARYRFIRSDDFDPSVMDYDLFYLTGEAFDAAIDAAMQEPQP